MNDQSAITLTLGDQAENHAGMQILGKLVDPGQGFHLDDLETIQTNLEAIGALCELVPLQLYQELGSVDATLDMPEEAYVLIIRDGVNKILQTCSDFTQQDMFEEHLV